MVSHPDGKSRSNIRVLVLNDPPARVSYEELLATYWRQIDPTTADRMFLDSGLQYSSAIFVAGPEQRKAAEVSRAALTAQHVFPAGPARNRSNTSFS